MKKYIVALLTSVAVLPLYAGSIAAVSGIAESVAYQSEERKEEITPRQLPEEARMDIVDNYHNAKILKVYKIWINGEHDGYLVEVQQGPKQWDIRYDSDGNPLNKINPIKS